MCKSRACSMLSYVDSPVAKGLSAESLVMSYVGFYRRNPQEGQKIFLHVPPQGFYYRFFPEIFELLVAFCKRDLSQLFLFSLG